MGLDNRARDRHSIEFKVAGKEIGYYCNKFEWVCFINAGHRVTASFRDTHQDVLDDGMIKQLLAKAKTNEGIDVELRIHQDYHRKKGKKTEKRKFKVLTLNSNLLGSLTEATLEFVCIDKASWLLNRGKCDGKARQGNVSKVIKEIVGEYAQGISAEVDETTDDKNNYWWDLRLDPKTIISSMIEWSSSITNNKTPLVIHCQDDEFKCREWANLPPTKVNGKKFYVAKKVGEIKEWTNRGELQILSNNLLSPSATRLYTGSISATTGLYIDKQNTQLDKRQQYADDKFTDQKLMPKVGADQSFTKSNSESGTFIEPVPEHNNGDVGLKYQDYAVGRARDWFIKTIYSTLRVKLTIEPGDTDFDSVYACGRDKINLEVLKLSDNKPYYINGNWMLYGFRHMCDWEHWKTELLLSRIDHDATGKGI
jgi:hypothetical protein